ncbi:hypothetical protein evm_004445 [Chilo suppressalis]|nr:hypothetical protein evm_004445 [Chilo suppressalis]
MDINQLIKKYSKNSLTAPKVYLSSFDTPVGKVAAAADDEFVYMITFVDSKNIEKKIQTISDEILCQFLNKKNRILQELEDELRLYFEGNCKKFTIPIKTIGSEFQKAVWNKLLELPYGSTQTYGDLAKSLGRSSSHARAIGAACGANAHLLVVPCHRLVATGTKGGFSSGIDRKEWLLQHEQKHTK